MVGTAGRSIGRLQEAGDTGIDVGMESGRRLTGWRRQEVTSGMVVDVWSVPIV